MYKCLILKYSFSSPLFLYNIFLLYTCYLNIKNRSRLFVRNIPYSTTEDDLLALFARFGAVNEIHIPVAADSNRRRGFAFVEFAAPLNALQAQVATDGKVFQGRPMRVQLAERESGHVAKSAKAKSSFDKQKKAKLQRYLILFILLSFF